MKNPGREIYDDLSTLYPLMEALRIEVGKMNGADRYHPLVIAAHCLVREFYPVTAKLREELRTIRESTPIGPIRYLGPRREQEGVTPPTLEEVKEYCASRKSIVDPEAFFDHYEMKGWKVGRTKMANWRAAVRVWERRTARWEES